MTSVGETLRTERESQGRGLAEIAEELCLTQHYLRAIEQDDLKNLPGTFFYKSFARQYGRILGIDETLLRAGIDALTAPVEPAPPAEFQPKTGLDRSSPEHFSTGVRRAPVRELDPIVQDGNRRYFPDRRIGVSLAGLALVLVGCSGFYAWWNRAPHSTASTARRPVSPTPVATAIKAIDNPSVPRAAPVVDVVTTTGADGLNHVVLNLSATEKTWLSLTSDGKQIFAGILEPSQTKTLTGLEVAKLKVGNAAGLEVRWNGKPIGPIGPRGQVRVILFTPENFQILSPTSTL